MKLVANTLSEASPLCGRGRRCLWHRRVKGRWRGASFGPHKIADETSLFRAPTFVLLPWYALGSWGDACGWCIPAKHGISGRPWIPWFTGRVRTRTRSVGKSLPAALALLTGRVRSRSRLVLVPVPDTRPWGRRRPEPPAGWGDVGAWAGVGSDRPFPPRVWRKASCRGKRIPSAGQQEGLASSSWTKDHFLSAGSVQRVLG